MYACIDSLDCLNIFVTCVRRMNRARERENGKERDVLRSIQALGYIVSALLYSQSLHLFIRQNKFAQALTHSLSHRTSNYSIGFSTCCWWLFFSTLLFIASACRLMCMCFVHILILLSNVCCFLLVSSRLYRITLFHRNIFHSYWQHKVKFNEPKTI